MAAHILPRDDGAPHALTAECGCGPQRTDMRPDGRPGATYHHRDMSADTRRQEVPDDAATGH